MGCSWETIKDYLNDSKLEFSLNLLAPSAVIAEASVL